MAAPTALTCLWQGPSPWPVACCKGRRGAHRQAFLEQCALPAQRAAAARRMVASKPTTAAASGGSGAGPGPTLSAQQAASSSSDASRYTAAALAGLRYESPDGRWVVRPLEKPNVSEVRRIVALQTDAFHTAAPLPFLDGMSKRFFEAEVLSEMQKKLKFNPDDMFISLVIEPKEPPSSSGSSSCNVIGVVEVSYIAQKETLKLLEPGTEAFCYIASMVVAPAWRRRGAAATLLAAAEAAAEAWDERQALLHVYQDNAAAIALYERAGYEVIWRQNPAWGSVGTRPRFLMRKRW